MSTLQPASPSELSRNPFEVARSHLIRRLLEVVVPKALPPFPNAGHFRAIAETLRDVAAIHDEFVRAIGDQVEVNAPSKFDSRDFDDVSSDSVGDALYALELIAEQMSEAREAV